MTDKNLLSDPIAQERLDFIGADGKPHVLLLALGKPFLTRTKTIDVWRCPFAYDVDGVSVSGSCGGPGIVAAIINAALTLEAQRAKLIDEPLLARQQ